MARFPSIDNTGAFEAPEVQDHIKNLVTAEDVGITVDTSVGTRVFIGDTMIYGDTGWRDVTEYLTDEWVPHNSSPRVYIKRENSRVSVELRLRKAGTADSNVSEVLHLPDGFRGTTYVPAIGGVQDHPRNSPQGILTFRSSHTVLDVRGVTWEDNQEFVAVGLFETSNAWPTSLPGTPR